MERGKGMRMLYGPTRSEGAAPEEPSPPVGESETPKSAAAPAATSEESSMPDRETDPPVEETETAAGAEEISAGAEEASAGAEGSSAGAEPGVDPADAAVGDTEEDRSESTPAGEAPKSAEADPIFERAGVSLGDAPPTPNKKAKAEPPVPPTDAKPGRITGQPADEPPAEAAVEERPGHPRFDLPKESKSAEADPEAAPEAAAAVATPDPLPPEQVDFRPDLETYSGPLGLLLYLIHKDEVDIFDIPISGILTQFLGHVRRLEATGQLDLQESGEYLVMAARLMEIKSRMLLPNEAEEEEELLEAEIEDPRWSLVKQLLEFREIKERAQLLEQAHRQRSQCFERIPGDLPAPEPGSLDLKETSPLDLQAAFQRVLDLLRERDAMRVVPGEEIPIEVAMSGIRDQLIALPKRQQMFSEIFPRDLGLRGLVSYFMALLELTRLRHLKLEQPDDFGDILVILREAA